jgi:hypothetical protein
VDVDEEVIMLEEQLATATADIERPQIALAEAQALAQTRDEQHRDLKSELAAALGTLGERDTALSGRDEEIAGLKLRLVEAQEEASLGVSRYRASLLASRPELPADLVQGDTVEALEQSVEYAMQTVAQVRQHLDQQAAAHRVPNGAPPRSAPDLSNLSPAEKIRAGIESNK